MNKDGTKIVDFSHCQTCRHKNDTDENPDGTVSDSPCDDCLSNPVNLYSKKPIHYKDGETKNG